MDLTFHTGTRGVTDGETNGVLNAGKIFGYKGSLRLNFLLMKNELIFCKEHLLFSEHF